MIRSVLVLCFAAALSACAGAFDPRDFDGDRGPPELSLEIAGMTAGGVPMVVPPGVSRIECAGGLVLEGRLVPVAAPPTFVTLRTTDDDSGVQAIAMTIGGADIGDARIDGAGEVEVRRTAHGGSVAWSAPFMLEPPGLDLQLPVAARSRTVEIFASVRDAAGYEARIDVVRIGPIDALCAG